MAQPDRAQINQVINAALEARRQNVSSTPTIQQTMPGAAMGTPPATVPPTTSPDNQIAVLAQRAQASQGQGTQPESPEETRVVTQLLLKKLQSLLSKTGQIV